MNGGKKQSRRMRGGMTTGEWGTAVFGGSDSQHAVGNGSNVISMRDPNSVVAPATAPAPAPVQGMKGGRKLKGGDLGDYIPTIPNPFAATPSPEDAAAPSPEAAPAKPTGGIMDQLSDMNPFDSTEATTTGGKGKRKSATKRRKSHKKKGKSSKKRAHKRR